MSINQNFRRNTFQCKRRQCLFDIYTIHELDVTETTAAGAYLFRTYSHLCPDRHELNYPIDDHPVHCTLSCLSIFTPVIRDRLLYMFGQSSTWSPMSMYKHVKRGKSLEHDWNVFRVLR